MLAAGRQLWGRDQSLWRKRWLCAQNVKAATMPLARSSSLDLRKRSRKIQVEGGRGRRLHKLYRMLMVNKVIN
jgi:hypothetical protein